MLIWRLQCHALNAVSKNITIAMRKNAKLFQVLDLLAHLLDQ
jgi:hypothetical protein